MTANTCNRQGRRDRRERHADAGDGARDDQGLAAGRLDGGDEVRIVPGVDLALAGNVLRVRRVLVDLRDQRPVRPLRNRGGGDHRKLAQRRDLRERGRMVAQRRHRHVADRLERPLWVVDQQHDGVICVDGRLLPLKLAIAVWMVVIAVLLWWWDEARGFRGR